MSPREFKEMLNQILRLTPAQKRRLMLGVQKSVKSDELPEPVRQREAELDRLRVCTHCGSSGVVRYWEVGRLVSISLPFGIVRTNLSRADRDSSCWLEAQVEVVGIRSVFARSADAASVGRAMRDRLPNRILVAASLAWQAVERLKTQRHRGDRTIPIFWRAAREISSLTKRCLPRERGGNRGRRGSGVGPAARLGGSISRRAD